MTLLLLPAARRQIFSSSPSLFSRQACHLTHTFTTSAAPSQKPSPASPPSPSSCSRINFFTRSSTRLPSLLRSLQQRRNLQLATMAPTQDISLTVDELATTLQGFGLKEVPASPNTYPAHNPFDIYRSHIAEQLSSASGIDRQIIQQALQWTSTLEKGDLVLAVPALRVKGKKPDALAAELVEKFPESPLVQKPTVQGIYLTFFFKPEPLNKVVVPGILKNGQAYGFNSNLGLKDPSDPAKGRQRMIVEFSSPNIAKPFHAGHLRSTIIGGFLANLYEKAGWDVIRMNYLGDWGKQYGVLAMGYKKYGNEEALVENPVGHLYDVYVKINKDMKAEEEAQEEKKAAIKAATEKGEDVTKLNEELQALLDNSINEQARKYFKSMESGDEEALALWRRFRELSIQKMEKTYNRLNISYDVYSGESVVKEESMEKAAKLMEENGVSELSEGAVIVDLGKKGFKKLGKAIVKKRDGTSIYLTRDLGAAMERFETYHFDRMIYVVASQQDLHLAQLFKILELMGLKEISSRCQHINFGMVQGMSTRKGTAKFLDDILRDVADKMHEVMKSNQTKYEQVEDPEKTADVLGISAVMVQDMKGKRINNYDFDMDRMTSFEGDTGPYLQYAHARLCSITRKAQISYEDLLTADMSLLKEKHAVDLVRSLASWPDVYLNTIKTQEPTTVLTYLFKMAHALSSSYDHLQVVGSEEPIKRARMALYTAARTVLGNGMRVLGLTPVERM